MASKGQGWRVTAVGGFEVRVGKGARANDALTFGGARPRDVWLHAAGYAGSHVVICNPDELELWELPPEVVERAAELAVWHSKARAAGGKVEVHVCRVADVRKPAGFAPGQVQLRNWHAVRVYPRRPEDET